jgi:hypothetical protein
MSHGPQSAPGNPRAAPLIARKRSPASGADLLAANIHSAANSTGAGNYNHARLAVSCTVERDICVTDDFQVSNTETAERFLDARAQFFATGASQTNLGRSNIFAAHLRHGASSVDCFAHSHRGTGDSNTQRV